MSITETAAGAASGLSGQVGNLVQSCPRVTLEIGVFFDGTGNNTANSNAGDGMTEAQRLARNDSYSNARSNVSLLHELYKNGDAYDIRNSCGGYARRFAAIYKDGIGTAAGQDDSTLSGQGMGLGGTGVESRVYEACLDVGAAINRLSPGVEPTEIILDVFGFSRGAAAARYFVNCFRQGYIDYYKNFVSPKRAYLPPGRKVRIRFVGIFDTVSSIAGPGSHGDGGLNLNLKPGQATRITHLTAMHEYRVNFPLTNIKGSGGQERPFLGAHSDVGGGYRDGDENTVVRAPRTSSFGTRTAAETARAEALRRAATERAGRANRWIRDGWIYENDTRHRFDNDPTPVQMRTIAGAMGSVQYVYSFTQGERLIRKGIKAGLSRIPLKVMYDAGAGVSVPFKPLPSGEAYKVPAPLAAIAGGYASGGGLPPAEAQRQILHDYGHVSCNLDGWKAKLVNRPTEGFIREIFDNQPSKAK